MAYDLPSFVPAPAPVAVAKPISAPVAVALAAPISALAPAPIAVAMPISAPIYTSSTSAISSPAAPNAVPTVNGTGLNSSTFNNLVNSQTASSFFSQLATQNLASVVSQISQTQISQLVSKFGTDSNFQTLLSTGSIPASALSGSQAPLAPNAVPGVVSGSPMPGVVTPTSGSSPSAPIPIVTPVVAGSGLASTTFNSLASATSANALLSQLSGMNLSQIGSQISQVQLNQIVNTFGADPAFQTFLSTGKIPLTVASSPVSASAALSTTSVGGTPTTAAVSSTTVAGLPIPSNGSATPNPVATPFVSGKGLDTTSFNNLANATTANSLLSQLATQNLASIASQISQSQLNQLVTKFGGDPNFQALLSTGSIPVSALQNNKALLSSSPAQQTLDPVQHPELYLIGLQLT